MNKEGLKELQHEMNTQDNLATSHPLYCVFEKERVYGMDSDYSDKYILLDSDGEEFDENDPEAEGESFKKVHYIEHSRFRNAHFTRKAAELYINQNAYNLTEPFVYIMSLYRCHEMIAIQEYFKTTEF